MFLLKKIVIIKLILMVLVSIFFAMLNNDSLYQLMYLFNVFCVLLTLIYICIAFKYIDKREFMIRKYVIMNLTIMVLLSPIMVIAFTPLMSIVNCVLFSLSVSDGVYFGLMILKFCRDVLINHNLIKLIPGNTFGKKN